MNTVKLSSIMSLATIGEYKSRKGGEAFGAFQVTRERANFHGIKLQVILPDVIEDGKVVGQGGRVAVGDGDWICKRGPDYTVIHDDVFAQDYERA